MNPTKKNGSLHTKTHESTHKQKNKQSEGLAPPHTIPLLPTTNHVERKMPIVDIDSFLPSTHLQSLHNFGHSNVLSHSSHLSLCSAMSSREAQYERSGMHTNYFPVSLLILKNLVADRSGDFVRLRGETRNQSTAVEWSLLQKQSSCHRLRLRARPIQQKTQTRAPSRSLFCYALFHAPLRRTSWY